MKKNKKNALSLSALITALSLGLSGCGSLPMSVQPDKDVNPKQPVQPKTITHSHNDISPVTRPRPYQPKTLHLSEKTPIKQAIEAQYQHQTQQAPDNLWDTFAGSFHLVRANQGHFEHSVSFYKKRQKHLIQVSKRATPYLYYIVQKVKERKMPMEIALLPIVESGFKAHAKSHAKALGLWQFMPATGKSLGLGKNWWYDGRRDVVKSTEAALTYLQRHYQNTNDWLLALASYNAGYGTVLRAIKRYERKHGKSEQLPTFWQISKYLPRETQNYVPSLLSVSYLIEHNDKYNIDIAPIANKPFFDIIELNNQVSLSAVAANTKVSSELLAKLNPAYVRQATPPNGPHHILLPIEKQPLFIQVYQKNAKEFEVHWQRHRVRSGDYLGKIAKRYNTSVTAIKRLNRMRSNFLRAGQTLLIPVVEDAGNLIQVAQASPSKRLQRKASNNGNKLASKSANHRQRSHYQVKSGDTLSEIAHRHKVDIRQIRAWNKLSRNSTLRIGQKLVLKQPQPPMQKRVHEVKAGETLSEIAYRNGVNVQQIRSWNNLGKQAIIRIGQKLVLDKNQIQNQKLIHTVKSGETLSEIAYAHGIDVELLKRWNSISSAKSLRPNQELNIWLGPNTSKHKQYTVRNGDNLWGIAKEFQLSVEGLARYNQMSKKTMLRPGQVLKIPFKTI